jgi:MFS family permease
MLVINSTMGSALPSMTIPDIIQDFGITSEEQSVLPISVYLIGYVLGPIVWGPLSEHYGRRNLSFVTFCLFTIFTMACAVAPTWPALLIFRFFCGAFASSPIAIVAGILADIYDDPRTRGRAFAIFMVVSYASITPPPRCARYKLTRAAVYHWWSHLISNPLRFRWSQHWLALGLLDCSHDRWCDHRPDRFSP